MRDLLGLELDPLVVAHELDLVAARLGDLDERPEILECDIKWALGSITMNKANEGDRIPAELF